VKIGVAL
jgi:superfamily II DNA helicase RecQ